MPGFTAQVKISQEIGFNLDDVYGVESGNKTILHLALEEDDGLLYCEELIKVLHFLYFYRIVIELFYNYEYIIL